MITYAYGDYMPSLFVLNKQPKLMVQLRLFLVEVVGVEPTSYAAAKKLSTYLVYLLFLKFATRVNTLCKPQEAKYSYKNTSRFL